MVLTVPLSQDGFSDTEYGVLLKVRIIESYLYLTYVVHKFYRYTAVCDHRTGFVSLLG